MKKEESELAQRKVDEDLIRCAGTKTRLVLCKSQKLGTVFANFHFLKPNFLVCTSKTKKNVGSLPLRTQSWRRSSASYGMARTQTAARRCACHPAAGLQLYYERDRRFLCSE